MIFFIISTFIQASERDSKPIKKMHQSGFFYGFMLAHKNEIYQGVDDDFMALPVVGYKSDDLNILGPFISYNFFKSDFYEFSALMRYRYAGYKSSDSDNFKGMEDRNASLDIGLGFNYKVNNWSAKLDVVHDVIGSSNGLELKGNIGKTFYFGPIFVEPNLGLIYWDKSYVDYYYGVEAYESNSNRPEYAPNSTLNKKLGLNISTPIFFGGFTRLSIEQTWYGSEISKSPLTDSNNNLSAILTFSRFF
jgi:outer membrane protein